MKRHTRNAIKSKQEIIQKSAAVFNIHGYSGAKMQMIIDATGYQKGGIYCHFQSKEELAKEAFLYNVKQLKLMYFDGIELSDSPTHKIRRFKRNYQSFLRSPTIRGGCPLLNTSIEFDDTNPEFKLYVVDALNDILTLFSSIFKEGQKSGEFKNDFNPKEEVNYMLATMEGAIMLGQIKQNSKLVLKISDRMFKNIGLTLGIDL